MHRTHYVQRCGAFVFVRRDSAFIGALHAMMLSGHRLCLGNGAQSQLLSTGKFSPHARLHPRRNASAIGPRDLPFATWWGWLLYDLVVVELSCRCRLLYGFTCIVCGSTCLLPLVGALSSQRPVSVKVKSNVFLDGRTRYSFTDLAA